MAEQGQDDRLIAIEECLLQAISGDLSTRVPVTARLDGIDGIATGVNILVQELRVRLDELHQVTRRAEASSLAKQRFLANMSHEIRTPMNGVLGMASLLALTELTEEQREYVEAIRGSGDSLLRLLDDILDFSRIESDTLALDLSESDIGELMEDVLMLLSERAWTKGLTLACVIDPEIDRLLLADAGRIRQILLNLLGNSLKFTREGGVTVRALVESETDEVQTIRFEVTDTGIGLEPGLFNAVFDSFYQVDTTSSREFGGAGLGLAISRHLVELMSGQIGVESGRNVGSSFWFALTLSRLPDWRSDAKVGLTLFGGQRVDIVISDESLSEALCMQLSYWGMEPQRVPLDRAEALDEEHALAPFAIFDGADVAATERMAERQGRFPGVQKMICLTTPHSQPAAKREASRLSVTHLQIPVRGSALVSALMSLGEDRPSVEGQKACLEAAPPKFCGRVLAAEDNPDNQRVLIRMLHKLGCDVHIAENGLDLLNAWRRDQFDLILMDCQMPRVDGYEATRVIREEEGDRRTPIVAVTAGAMWDDRQRSLDAGMDDYLAKPLTTKRLAEVLGRWLQQVS